MSCLFSFGRSIEVLHLAHTGCRWGGKGIRTWNHYLLLLYAILHILSFHCYPNASSSRCHITPSHKCEKRCFDVNSTNSSKRTGVIQSFWEELQLQPYICTYVGMSSYDTRDDYSSSTFPNSSQLRRCIPSYIMSSFNFFPSTFSKYYLFIRYIHGMDRRYKRIIHSRKFESIWRLPHA